MALAARTATLCLVSCSMSTESLTIFLMFRGVMLESDICCRLTTALASFASFYCCFLSLALMGLPEFQSAASKCGIKCFSPCVVFYTSTAVGAILSSAPKDKMKLAAELVSRGATMLADPCPQCGGIQVRYRGKVYCTSHDDLSLITRAVTVSYDSVVAQMREVLLVKLNETTVALGTEKDPMKQEQLATLSAKYFELLQKLPRK